MAKKIRPKYVCYNCGKSFDEPRYYRECMGEFWGAPAYETFEVCPYCGDDCIESREVDNEHKSSETKGTKEV